MRGGEEMKKIIGVAMVSLLVVTSTAFALPFATTKSSTKTTVKAVPAPPALSAAPARVMHSGDAGKWGLGLSGGMPSARYNFSDDARGYGGISFASAAGASTFNLMLAGDADLTRISGNEVNMGGAFYLNSTAGATTWTGAITCGVDAKLNPGLVVEFKVWPISITSAAGTTTFSILGVGTVGAHIYL